MTARRDLGLDGSIGDPLAARSIEQGDHDMIGVQPRRLGRLVLQAPAPVGVLGNPLGWNDAQVHHHAVDELRLVEMSRRRHGGRQERERRDHGAEYAEECCPWHRRPHSMARGRRAATRHPSPLYPAADAHS